MSIFFNTPIWDSVQLHLILIFGKKGAEIMGQSKYTLIICTVWRKQQWNNCKTELLGDKNKQVKKVKDHSSNEIKRCMQNIE